ncbi:MAG: type II secretion system F family protein [Planctomycetota bacterium]
MAVFAYQAFDARQQVLRGTLAADTPASARQLLRDRGLFIAGLTPVRADAGCWWRGGVRFGVRRREEALAELWRNLAVLLEAGVPLADALDVCIRQQRGSVQRLLRQLLEAVRSGESFAASLAAQPGWCDDLTRAVVQVGERSGALGPALAELADYQGRRRAVANRVSTALIYPVILCLVGCAVVLFLMTHVMPQLLAVLQSAGRDLPAPTRLLKAISDALLAWWPVLVGGAAAVVLGIAAARRTAPGRRLSERALLALPVLGDLLRKAWIARISLMLATLLRSDVRFTDAVRTVRRELPHQLYADELAALERAVEAGASIAEPLRHSRLMPPLVVHLLAVGQESGELPGMLDRLRSTYEQQVQLALARFLAVLEPALILVLAVVIGFVVFATLLPILETTKVVQ